MKHLFTAILVFVFFLFNGKPALSQTHDEPVHPSVIKTGVFLGVTPPLRDIPPLTPAEMEMANKIAIKKARRNEEKQLRHYPFASTALPKGPDAARQDFMGENHQPLAPIQNFEGQTTSSYPPDCNGTVGPNHFFQTVNVTYSIYNRTGTLLAGPTALNTLFTGVPGATQNDGDPIVLYDDQAQRWLVAEFTFNLSNDYMLVAVSQTSDPTGSWYKYSFDVTNDPDYPKFGVWQDGYYMGINSSSGNDIYVFERSKMLLGQTAQMIGFDNTWRPGPSTDFVCVPPLDNDGPAAPTGSPGLFIAFNDDAVGGGNDELWIYELTANWTTPASSTFTRSQQIGVTSFDSQFTTSWDDITQPNVQKLDGVPAVIMNAPQYRNFGTYQTIVCCHTVDVDATNHAGVRWYELRKTPPATTWTVRQQGTYAPDIHSRWMGSIMLNGAGKIGLAYSISSSTIYPGIRFTGQSASAYTNATGVMDITEDNIYTGLYAQTGYNRWGDYALMSVDPTDDQTFWFSTEYVKSGGTSKGSRIASFKFGNSPTATTLAATSITGTSATLNGTINPNGLSTNYYFQWGTTTSYGNTTTTIAAGSGTVNVNASAGISGLTGGTTYHYRVVGVNSDGTTNGSDMTVTPGAAVVTTTAITGITGSTATSGGNVTSDGGASVTARGVCWSTSANPVVGVNSTTDGSGTGTFTSSISGLTSNTTYYVRAYATNASGTFYGNQLQFTTLCGVFSLPFTENFTASTLPSCWTKQQTGTATDKWTVSNTANAGGTAYEMKSSYQSISSATVRLVTPPINTIGVTQLNLSFKHMLDAYGTGCTLRVQSSTDAVTWTNEAWSVASTSSNIAATTVTTTILSNLNSASTYIAFTIEGNLFQYDYWYLDNISVVNNCSTTYPVSVAIAASANPVCAGTSVTYTATPSNGGSSPAYQWKVNGTNAGTNVTYSYTPANGDVVTCVLTSNLSCTTGNPATSNSVTMTVNSLLPVSVSVAPSVNPVCAGTSVTFTATPVNGGTTPLYQWKVNGTNTGSGGTTYSYIPVNGDAVTCVLTSNATCPSGNPATSAAVNMSVNPVLPVSVSVAPSANPVCAGTSVTFTATPVNGGTTPSYQWKVNGTNVGTGGTTYSYIPANGDLVNVIMTSSLTCKSGSPATSNTITAIVNPSLPASVSVSPSATTICAGTSVTFTATPVNGGTTPFYQWKVNGSIAGTNSPVYSYYPVNNDAVICVLTSNAACATGSPATSNTTTLTVNPNLPVSVSIAASANPVCTGTSVTFTPSPINGGSPTYEWFKNSALVGTGSTYSCVPANGDLVNVIMTSSLTCKSGSPATSNTITAIVNPSLPVSVSVSPSATTICAGTSVTFTATPVNGGATPSYQWKVNGSIAGTNSPVYSYYPVNNDAVICVLTSNAACATGSPATSNTTTMTVNPNLPVSVSIAASANPACQGSSVTFTPIPVNGGTPSYQWYKNALPVGTGSDYTFIPETGDQVNVVMTSTNTCSSGSPATSNMITMVVNPLLPVVVSIYTPTDNVCAGASVTFTASPINGGTNPDFQWMINGNNAGTSSSDFTYVPVNGDVVTCEMTSSAPCISGSPSVSNPVTMTVNSYLPVSVSILPSENPVTDGTMVTFTATPVNGGTNPVYQWNVNGIIVGTNSPVYSYFPANNDMVTCTLISDLSCVSGNPAISPVVTMIVNPRILIVEPSNRDVSLYEGTTTFDVTSNTGWTVVSDQAWCPADLSGSGNGTIHASYSENASASARIANITVTAGGLAPVTVTVTQAGASAKSLTVKVFLEGLYEDAGLMRQAHDASGPHFPAGIADQVVIELHNSFSYPVVEYSSGPVNVTTGGIAVVSSIPATYGGAYYITVRHRNSIETTSFLPVSFTGSSVSYDFTTASSMAYGNNLADKNGVYVIFTGDVNQDGVIDPADMLQMESDANSFMTGYIPADVNGDGMVDLSDMLPVDYNINLPVSASHP